MRKWITYSICMGVLLGVLTQFTSPLEAKFKLETHDILIEVNPTPEEVNEKKPSDYTNKYERYRRAQRLKYLEARVYYLERALRNLQEHMYYIEASRQKNKEYSVLLKTPFAGTFLGKGATKTEAFATVLQKCEKAGGGIWCNEDRVKEVSEDNNN